MPGEERAPQKIDACLEARQMAVGARIGKGPIMIVDRLAEEAAPHREGPGAEPTASRGRRNLGPLAHDWSARRHARRASVRVGIPHPVVERAQCRKPQLPRERLHHSIGCDLRPEDRKGDVRRQRLSRRLWRQDRRLWQDRTRRYWCRRYWCRRWDEVGAQKPIGRVAATDATLEQTVVEGAGSQFASGQHEGTRR